MELQPLSKSTCAIVYMSKVAGTVLANKTVVSSTCNEKANAEREVIATKVTGPAARTILVRSTLPGSPSSLQGLMEDHDGFDICSP